MCIKIFFSVLVAIIVFFSWADYAYGEFAFKIYSGNCLSGKGQEIQNLYSELAKSVGYKRNGMNCQLTSDLDHIVCAVTKEKIDWIGLWNNERQRAIESTILNGTCTTQIGPYDNQRTCEKFYDNQLASKEGTEISLREKLTICMESMKAEKDVVLEAKYSNCIKQVAELKTSLKLLEKEKLAEKTIVTAANNKTGKFRRELHKPWLETTKVENSTGGTESTTIKPEECMKRTKIEKFISKLFVPLIIMETIVNLMLLYLVVSQIYNSWVKYKAGKRIWLVLLFFYFLVESLYNCIIVIWHLIENDKVV